MIITESSSGSVSSFVRRAALLRTPTKRKKPISEDALGGGKNVDLTTVGARIDRELKYPDEFLDNGAKDRPALPP